MYNIGQLLWLIVDATKSIEPVQVVSKTTLESMDGSTTRHNVRDADDTQVCLEDFDAAVFGTVEEAEAHLLSLATSLVKKLVTVAEKKASKFNISNIQEPASDTPKPMQPVADRDGLPMVELPDGTMARVHLPESLQ